MTHPPNRPRGRPPGSELPGYRVGNTRPRPAQDRPPISIPARPLPRTPCRAGSKVGPEALGDCNAGARAVTALLGMTKYDPHMAVERLTVSIESELASAVREAANADELNVSAWLADAARRQLANRGLRDVVAAWEREHGAFSDEELASARALIDG